MKEKYKIVFHGTQKENIKSILKSGFKKNSYFAINLADALEFGGEYIFYVILKLKRGDTDWQPRAGRKIPASRITRLVRVNPKMLYENDKPGERFFGKGEKYPCPNCGAEIGKVKLSIFGKPTKPRCPKCKKTFKQLFLQHLPKI